MLLTLLERQTRKILVYKTLDELFEAKLDEIYSAWLGKMCNLFLQFTKKSVSKVYQKCINKTKQNAETRLPTGFSAFCLFLEEKNMNLLFTANSSIVK